MPAQTAFYIGLALVAIGTGLFKPNISAMVGALYAPGDERRDAGFSIFYMGINVGGFLAPLVTGFLAQSDTFKGWLSAGGFDPADSWHWGFGAAGVGMTFGLIAYMLQAKRLAHVGRAPAGRTGSWVTSLLVVVGTLGVMALTVLSDDPRFHWLRAAFILIPVAAIVWFAMRGDLDGQRLAAVFVFFIAAMVFWAIFEQAGITIALFGLELTRNSAGGFPFPAAWFQSLNSLFVIILAPLFALAWLRLGRHQPSSPAKFAFGLFFLGLSFLLMVPAAMLTAEGRVSPLWLVGLFFLQTVGELLLSPVGLSTMTRAGAAAPRRPRARRVVPRRRVGQQAGRHPGQRLHVDRSAGAGHLLPAAGGDGRRRDAGAAAAGAVAEAADGRRPLGRQAVHAAWALSFISL